WPNGCHVCEVEIDPETGAVSLVAYVIADDVGTVINPLTLKGQIHGGVAQGVGQALMEQIVYDPDSGQLLTGSFMDYALPRADTLPDVVVESHPVPTKLNPLGAKGAGEAGTVGALPVVMNAVLDALAPLGVRHLDMPASAERVWNAIRGYDTRFFEWMPQKLFAHRPDMADNYAKNPALAEITAFRNGTLQGAYFMLAARAVGLDVGGMSGFDNAKVNAEFFPDGRVKSNFLCNLGHGDPTKVLPRLPRLDFDEACALL